jgi:integrase
MARSVEGPWYRASKDGWYVTHEGRSVSLKVRGKANRGEALKAWHRLMAGVELRPDKTKPTPTPEAAPLTMKQLADAFLAARKGVVKADTHAVYQSRIHAAVDAFHEVPDADAFTRWLHALTLSQSSKSSIAGIVMAATRWGTMAGLLPADPLKWVKKPPITSRGSKALVSDEAHAKVMAVAGPELRIMLTLLRETGARPGELARITAKDVDTANGVAVLADHKTAHHTGKPRLLILTPQAVALLRPLMDERPEGPLLRNALGNPWTKDAIGHAMRRVCERIGVKAIAYGYRHTFATEALAAGVPDATVAALLGHCDTSMIHRHYSHLSSRTQALKDALGKVRGGE